MSHSMDPKSPDFIGPCPRCGGCVPNDQEPGRFPGALSRADNETYVCSACGSLEAMFEFFHRDVPLPAVTEPMPGATDLWYRK